MIPIIRTVPESGDGEAIAARHRKGRLHNVPLVALP